MPPELLQAAHHVAGEVGTSIAFCGFTAQLAAMWVYQRNRTFYATATPTAFHLWLALVYPKLPDPTGGARYMFSREDLQQPRVQKIVADRAPPALKIECAGGLELYFYK